MKYALQGGMTLSKPKPEQMLANLQQMEDKLAELQRKLRASKTGDINDSFFTPENIEAAIRMLQEVYPEEKYMIYALQALLPLSRKKNEEIQQQEKKMNVSTASSQEESSTQWTAKLKSKVSPNRMI